MNLLLAAVNTGGLGGLLIVFLVALVALVILGGLIWAVETYIIKGSLPNPVRLVIGLVIIVILVIYVINHMGGL